MAELTNNEVLERAIANKKINGAIDEAQTAGELEALRTGDIWGLQTLIAENEADNFLAAWQTPAEYDGDLVSISALIARLDERIAELEVVEAQEDVDQAEEIADEEDAQAAEAEVKALEAEVKALEAEAKLAEAKLARARSASNSPSRGKQPKGPAKKSLAPAGAKKAEVVPEEKPKAAASDEVKRVGLASNDVFDYIHTELKKLDVKPEKFWEVADPEAEYRRLKKEKKTPNLNELKYRAFTEPYKKKPKRAQLLNNRVLSELNEGLLIAAEAQGMYGPGAQLGFKIVVDTKTGTEEKSYFVGAKKATNARLLFNHRIAVANGLATRIGKKDPAAPKIKGRALLSEPAVKWVNAESFDTFIGTGKDRKPVSLKAWLEKELKTKFANTNLAKGQTTAANYTRLLHLALRKTTHDEKGNLLKPKDSAPRGTAKPTSVYDYTKALKELNEAKSPLIYNGTGTNKKKVRDPKGPTKKVAEVIIEAVPAGRYSKDELYLDSIFTLRGITTHSKSTADDEGVKFLNGDTTADNFDLENQLIERFYALTKPALDEAAKAYKATLPKPEKKPAAVKRRAARS